MGRVLAGVVKLQVVTTSCYVKRTSCYVKRTSCYVKRTSCYVKRTSCYVKRTSCYVKRTSCYRSANKLFQICSQADDKLCSHCLFLVAVTSLEQAVSNL